MNLEGFKAFVDRLHSCDDDYDDDCASWPTSLGKSLSDGGALCAAWYQGNRHAMQRYLMTTVKIYNFDWIPGCGRKAIGVP